MYEIYKSYAVYNKKTNDQVLELFSSMNEEDIRKTEKSHFNSIPETLKHLIITDYRWLGRLEIITGKKIIDDEIENMKNRIEILSTEDTEMRPILVETRNLFDNIILSSIELLEGLDFNKEFDVPFGQGKLIKPLWKLLFQWFNHQTHHRGQLSVLFDLAGYENDFSSSVNKI